MKDATSSSAHKASAWPRPLPGLAIGAIGVLAGVVAAGWVMLHARHDDDRAHGDRALVRVQIQRGASADEIVAILADRGLAPYPRLAYWALRYEDVFDRVQAGIYELPAMANILELADRLKRPPTLRQVELTLIPGESVWQSAERIERAGLGSAEEVLALAASYERVRAWVGPLVGGRRRRRADGVRPTYLEGFLAPETYYLRTDARAEDAIVKATQHFMVTWGRLATRLRADRMALRRRYGVDDRAILIVASLVEREVVDRDEGPRVAGVFYNRLARRMPLQTDPTLVYHPGRVGAKPTPADRRDVTNPYNTYARAGLPPGPICSPSTAAVEAAMKPERHDLLYFVARRQGRGRHAFARTLRQHRANIERYLR